MDNHNDTTFTTIEEIVKALEIYHHPATFRTCYRYVGGHGDALLAETDDGDENPDVEAEMLVPCNGRGWALGQWGRDFGHPDLQATQALYDATARCKECGCLMEAVEYPGLGYLCYDCLTDYIPADVYYPTGETPMAEVTEAME